MARTERFPSGRTKFTPTVQIDKNGAEFIHEARERLVEMGDVATAQRCMIIQDEIAPVEAARLQVPDRRAYHRHPVNRIVAQRKERVLPPCAVQAAKEQ